MNYLNLKSTLLVCLSVLVMALPAGVQAEHHETAETKDRVVTMSIEAEITHVDLKTREVTMKSPMGELTTVTVGEHVQRLEDFAAGDLIAITYIASLEGELREPTDAEIAEPWVELDAAAKADLDMDPGAIVGRVIQAVCTIEGMNRVTGTVMVQDPRGKYHVIGDVEPEKMEGVTLGTTLVLTYSEALAVTLEKKVAVAQ
jgi:hypothetical protein